MMKHDGMMSLAAAVLLVGTLARGGAAENMLAASPKRVTAETRADPVTLAELERAGSLVFEDDFESSESLKKYFVIRGLREGNAKLTTEGGLAHLGNGAIQFTAVAQEGGESGAGAIGWLGPLGYDRLYFRRYIRFAADYDQGNLHHVGGGLTGAAGIDPGGNMGAAGVQPQGNDYFMSAFEPWRGWGRYPPPGFMFLYTYWVDMKPDRDGHYWGNMLEPAEHERVALRRDRWYCLEHMIQTNNPGKANGELAAWIDGKLYIHYKGIRWRTTPDVMLKRFRIGIYVHRAKRDNTVWYDDVALSTGYIGPVEGSVPGPPGPGLPPNENSP
jgi:hypothetical protein